MKEKIIQRWKAYSSSEKVASLGMISVVIVLIITFGIVSPLKEYADSAYKRRVKAEGDLQWIAQQKSLLLKLSGSRAANISPGTLLTHIDQTMMRNGITAVMDNHSSQEVKVQIAAIQFSHLISIINELQEEFGIEVLQLNTVAQSDKNDVVSVTEMVLKHGQ
ncbi:type II secretion system protein GspM [Erwinia tasmaniensis]|uniref:type II secretion system protein GspM n=1 Tax=Erwinia tasmaniensis TaxID=338565 RepID=UPI003A4E3732